MTCTTHHICDCQKERMEKLEQVVRESKNVLQRYMDAYEFSTGVRKIPDAMGELASAIAALELIGGGE